MRKNVSFMDHQSQSSPPLTASLRPRQTSPDGRRPLRPALSKRASAGHSTLDLADEDSSQHGLDQPSPPGHPSGGGGQPWRFDEPHEPARPSSGRLTPEAAPQSRPSSGQLSPEMLGDAVGSLTAAIRSTLSGLQGGGGGDGGGEDGGEPRRSYETRAGGDGQPLYLL